MGRQLGAACFRSGEIEFVGRVPPGMLLITRAPARQLREVVSALARHAYDGETLLVPGVPEADDGDAALRAVSAFADRIRNRLVPAPRR